MLKPYRQKRNFRKTPEPRGKPTKPNGPLRFYVQLHRASRLHYDFRLEVDGVLKSWAVPKGPSLNPNDRRLAMHVEDHPLDYGPFEGTIPKGNYGAGTVLQWDHGTYVERHSGSRTQSERAMREGLARGKLTFVLHGEKLKGEFALIKLNEKNSSAWLLIKKTDSFAVYAGDDVRLPKKKKPRSLSVDQELIATQTKPEKKVMPPIVKPMGFTPGKRPFGKFWQFLNAGSGLRALCELKNGRVRIYSRHGLPLEKKYPTLVSELKNFREDLILDGEIIQKPRLRYRVYDLLFDNGYDLRPLSLQRRYRRLEKKRFPSCVEIVLPATGSPPTIARDRRCLYKSGLHSVWIKINQDAAEVVARGPVFSNVDKIYFPKDHISKGEVIEYYRRVAPYILPYLKDRPLSLNRHPNGIDAKGFYQKNWTGYHPKWLQTFPVESKSTQQTIEYVLCQNVNSLLYLVNLGCVEFNPWLSTTKTPERPEFCVIDLDPDDGNTFAQVIKVAELFHRLLLKLKLPHFLKTSGATGLHIVVPLRSKYEYSESREFADLLCQLVQKKVPHFTSMHRTPSRRRGKIYLDYLQNRRGQTLAAPYSLRPVAGAQVSTPLVWDELNEKLKPSNFNINNILARLHQRGDLWQTMASTKPADLKKAARRLSTNDFTF
jgi:DNA ligase D-like protein (predicted polymerase)/DNA ligase D-like protein (predicted 3'-phosphoesterase)